MLVDVGEVSGRYYDLVWFDDDDDNHDLPALSADEDSMLLNTVRLRISKSKDSEYHAYTVKFARGNSPMEAEQTASMVSFPVTQSDSILYLPKGFGVSRESKFRNQQVLVVLEVPVGKAVRIDRNLEWFSWFTINTGSKGIHIDIDEDWDGSYSWRSDVWYVMTDKGLERMDKSDEKRENNPEKTDEDAPKEGEYRYKGGKDTIEIKVKDKDTSVNIKVTTDVKVKEGDDSGNESVTVGKGSAGERSSFLSLLGLIKVGTK
jgi:hypothetical protein